MQAVQVVKKKKLNLERVAVKVFLTAFLWLIIFDPPIIAQFNIIHLLGLIAIGYFFFKGKIAKSLLQMEFAVILFFAYMVIVRLTHGNSAIITLYQVYWLVDIIPLSYMIVDICKKNNIGFKDFEVLLIAAGIIAATFALISFVHDGLHDLFISMLLKAGHNVNRTETFKYRMYGFASGLLYSSPIALALLSLLSLNRMINGGKWRYLVFSFILIIAGYISARTAIVVFLGGVVFLFVIHLKKIKRFIWVFLICFLALFVVYRGLKTQIKDLGGVYNQRLYWLYDGLANIFSIFDGSVTTYYDSTGYFFDPTRWQFPKNILDIFLGTGATIMENSSSGIYSDIGFVNDIWFGGIIYSLAIYFCFSWIIVSIYKNLRFFGKKYSLGVAGILCLGVVVSNLKGIAFSFNDFTTLVLLVFVFTFNKKAAQNE